MVGRVGQQRLVKVLQHGVQPVAKVALVHFGIQFVGLAQTQLALCKEAVRTMAQVGIRGRGQVRHRQRLAHGLGTQCGGGGHCTGRTVVRAGCSGAIQLQGQHQGAGQQGLTALVAGAPQHVHHGRAQGVGPGGPLGGLQRLACGQAPGLALSLRPVA